MHKASVITYSDRAKAVCTCGTFEGSELVGANAARRAVLEAKNHIASVDVDYVSWSFNSRTASFFASKEVVTEYEKCPECNETIDMIPDLFDKVSCSGGHKYLLRETDTDFHLVKKRSRKGTEVINLDDERHLCPVCSSTLSIFFETLSQVRGQRVLYSHCQDGHNFVAHLESPTRARLVRRGL